MATFKEVLTVEGKNLIARMLSGSSNITFTKIVMGDGAISQSELAIVNKVVNPKKELDIYSVTRDGNNSITVTSIFSNDGIQEGFYFREKGIYATDGNEEILFLYGNNGSLAEWINPIGNAVIQKKLSTVISFSESDQLNVSLQEGIYASHEDTLKIIEEIHNIDLDGDWAKYEQAEQIYENIEDVQKQIGKSSDSENVHSVFGIINKIVQLVDATKKGIEAFRNTYTDDRAIKLDKIDTTISSRAPASTALSTYTWTDARATKLDNIGNPDDSGGSLTSGTAMAKLNATLSKILSGGIAGTVKSIQNGHILLQQCTSYEDTGFGNPSTKYYYCDIPIAAVNLSKSVVVITARKTNNDFAYAATGYLINSTTLRLFSNGSIYSGGSYIPYLLNYNWQVVEYY